MMERAIWLVQLMVQQHSLLQTTPRHCTFIVPHTVSTLLLLASYKHSQHDGCGRQSVSILCCHPKRQRALELAISDTQSSLSVHKLKDLCRTRWVQRIDALQVFCSLHQSTVACICNDGPRLWSSDSLTDARSLQLAITTTDFL